MRIYNSIKVNRFLFLSLVIGSIGWVNLQTSATVGSEFGQSATYAEDHRGSGRCDNGCPSSQSFDSTEIARRGSGRIDSNQAT
ncbi:hypothetical protein [Roseofilum capinflatum]|uniref:Secreted protein n=1 Tax=Roseofilum capinflatum BLCC-M114 TaxID=3022440 RepID=A0ABT7B401_9CYAN|nr:hypothetical protein [Roseofilum capinflatum]MDJ1173912.1 hypothetical protein [Roseofilum capinflatum BLCC-M114]